MTTRNRLFGVLVFSFSLGLFGCNEVELLTNPPQDAGPPILIAGNPDPDFPYEIPNHLVGSVSTISIDTSLKKPFSRAIYGFNANVIPTGSNWSDPVLQEMVATLLPGSLRFPGGHAANFYKWRKDGEVFDNYWGWPEDGKRVDKQLTAFTNSGLTVGLPDYVALVKSLDIEPILMLNVLTQTVEEGVSMIRELRETLGLDLKKVELGNENYFQGQNNPQTADVNGYINVTEQFAAAIRAEYSDIDISVCIRPVSSPQEIWNGPLSQQSTADAVSPHQYGYGIDEEPGTPTAPPESEKITAMLGPEPLIDGYTEGLKSQFPGRKAWVTEWNMLPNGGDPLDGLPIHALFLMSSFLQRLSYPGLYEVGNLHNLIRAFASIDNGVYDPTKSKAEFPFWILVGQALAGCDTILKSEVTPHTVDGWSFPYANAKVFETAEEIRVLFLNKLPVGKKVQLVVDGQPWTAGGDLFTRGYSQLKTLPDIGPGNDGIVYQPFTGSTVLVSAYSLTEFILKKNP